MSAHKLVLPCLPISSLDMNLPPNFLSFYGPSQPICMRVALVFVVFSYPLFFVKDLRSSLNLEFTWRFPLRPLFYDSRWRRNSGRRAAEKIANIKKSSFLAQFLKLWGLIQKDLNFWQIVHPNYLLSIYIPIPKRKLTRTGICMCLAFFAEMKI